MLGPRRLLILDSFAAHKCPDMLEKFKELDLDVAMIPGGYTPLDIGVNTSFIWSFWLARYSLFVTWDKKVEFETINFDRHWYNLALSTNNAIFVNKTFRKFLQWYQVRINNSKKIIPQKSFTFWNYCTCPIFNLDRNGTNHILNDALVSYYGISR